ncbi:MAG: ABC transporter ATP-binding protein, partial [Muribaculaceae bacterium]|nr:ABC transporter ATP-binding protein [Muribaculaceae bacterium]
MNSSISVSRLATGYIRRDGSKITITNPFDATLKSGMLTCLLGRNGSGKSTLLRTLSAFQPPVGGDIFVDGERIDEMSDVEKSRLIGVVLTEKINGENLTATELVALGRSPYTNFWGRLREDDRQVVEKSLAIVGASNLADRRVATLSDGARQKVV